MSRSEIKKAVWHELLELPATADFHVHLRDGPMMEAVVPTIRQGGSDLVYVMPNLMPPITTVDAALAYQKRLQALEPTVKFLMTLYLHPSITPEVVKQAKAAGIRGIKSYPAGVTTNSSLGVYDYGSFDAVFAEMERQHMVLNLHGECPPAQDITVLNAEERFLPTLLDLHARFPRLRIVLEHCTTAAAIAAVRSCGPTVAGTITAHHLFLTVDDWAGDSFHFCKPVAKTPHDRQALLRAASSGHAQFFLGSDSAPHSVSAKRGGPTGQLKHAAGIFTQPHVTALVVEAFEQAIQSGMLDPDAISIDHLSNFLSGHGRAFYGEPLSTGTIRLTSEKVEVEESIKARDVEVVLFHRGQSLRRLEWLESP